MSHTAFALGSNAAVSKTPSPCCLPEGRKETSLQKVGPWQEPLDQCRCYSGLIRLCVSRWDGMG